MIAILNNLISSLIMIPIGFILDDLILLSVNPFGFVAISSSLVFFEGLIGKSIAKDLTVIYLSWKRRSMCTAQINSKVEFAPILKKIAIKNPLNKMYEHINSGLKNMNTNIKTIAVTSALVLALSILSVGITQASTFILLTGQLDYGQTSTNVTNLQTFLASSPSIYPQGRVTGYFGPLTKSAVMNFQNAYGIAQVGRVGPQTLAKINDLISSGVGLTGGPVYGNSTIAPTIYSISVSTSNTSAIVNWTTDENTTAKVYYSATPFQLAEATSNFTRPTIVGGTQTPKTTSMQRSQSITLTNLQTHTTYYYIIEALDADGNVSYTWPTTFTTNN